MHARKDDDNIYCMQLHACACIATSSICMQCTYSLFVGSGTIRTFSTDTTHSIVHILLLDPCGEDEK
jgi:hypothetical protein